jgi:hypothetical protein
MVFPDGGSHLRSGSEQTLVRGQRRTANLNPTWLIVSALRTVHPNDHQSAANLGEIAEPDALV